MQVEINGVIIWASGCLFMTVIGVVSAWICGQKSVREGEHLGAIIGTVFSVVFTVISFVSFCYLFFSILGKVKDSM